MKQQFITGIDHPALAAEDPAKLAEWYCGALGCELVCRSEKSVHILRCADGTMIEVMPRDETARPERSVRTPGWSHLAFRTDDLERAAAHLESCGVFPGPAVDAVGGGRLRSFHDPEGNMLQIVKR